MLSENMKIVPLLNNANFGAGFDTDSFKALGSRVTVIMQFGAVSGDAVLKCYSGASAGAKTSAMNFKIAVGGGVVGAASADVLTAWTDVVAATGTELTGATYQNKVAVCEIDVAAMDVTNGEEWLTMEISSAATSGILHMVAILEKPRYTENMSATLLA